MTIYNVYDELAALIATLPPVKVMAFKANAEMQQRFEHLVEKLKTAELSAQEKDELDHFIVLERLMRLAKIRADQP